MLRCHDCGLVGSATCVLYPADETPREIDGTTTFNHNYRSSKEDVGLNERPIRGARMSKDRTASSREGWKKEELSGQRVLDSVKGQRRGTKSVRVVECSKSVASRV